MTHSFKKLHLGRLLTTFLCFSFFIILTSISEPVFAQDGDFYRIETRDGNVFIGQVISETDEQVVIVTESIGKITIDRVNIRSMAKIDESQIRGGVYWYDNPQATRYLFAPNAIGLRGGHGYYQNTWILFNNVNYGITNNISVGGGLVPMFLFGTSSTPFWITPKISIPVASDNIHLAAGALIGGITGEDSGMGGIFYGTSTFGNTDRNVSLGLGYGFGGGDISSTPTLNVSGMLRATRSIYLISENYFFPGTSFNGIASAGARWAPENFAVDFALVRPLEGLGFFIGVPWLSVTIPFGR